MPLVFKIRIKGLTKYYGSTRGIENLDLEIQSGEIFGFLGENGAGKTTTIRCMMNILLPTQGEIWLNGDLVNRNNPKIRENIGYIPGEMMLPESYTVDEFLSYIANMRRRPSSRRKELCDRFGLPIKKKISDLSKGNKQKLGIIIAFMHDPDLLILDEPSAGLDPLLQQEFYDLVLEEKNRGKTIFLSSHNLAEVQRICDRVGIVKDGFLINIEDISSLSKSVPRILQARLGKPNKQLLASLGEKLLDSDDDRVRILVHQDESIKDLLELLIPMDPEEFAYPPASLEEYFLQFYQEKEEAKAA